MPAHTKAKNLTGLKRVSMFNFTHNKNRGLSKEAETAIVCSIDSTLDSKLHLRLREQGYYHLGQTVLTPF